MTTTSNLYFRSASKKEEGIFIDFKQKQVYVKCYNQICQTLIGYDKKEYLGSYEQQFGTYCCTHTHINLQVHKQPHTRYMLKSECLCASTNSDNKKTKTSPLTEFCLSCIEKETPINIQLVTSKSIFEKEQNQVDINAVVDLALQSDEEDLLELDATELAKKTVDYLYM